MLYKQNSSEALSIELFKNPTSEYRGAPFWIWNTKLDEKEILRQIEELKKMGFGGFHIHTRSGLKTEYLSDEFMSLVKACVNKAKEENMLAWLYDEDRAPSGFAGGLVTGIQKYRQRFLRFTENKNENTVSEEDAVHSGGTYLVGIYDIELNENGELESYRLIENEKDALHTVRYAYCEASPVEGGCNDTSYVDVFSKEAIDKFIEVTHEKYKETLSDEFGKTVPAIFTDEPQFATKRPLPSALSNADAILPWTFGFEKKFSKAVGCDVVKHLPEVIWELPDGKISRVRYLFHDFSCELFTNSFTDNIGNWCKSNSLPLTGHMAEECTLYKQTAAIGEAMRAYRSFDIPGIDMLCDYREHATAKQAQSSVRQYGAEGMVSELYGVTNWDFDFRRHKFQGDWQAAMGVTIRVPHLSWVSMNGATKRDYPASINYQSPWYKEYPYIEDHFARLATVLTRGKPCVNVGVLHPIESYWLHFGPLEDTLKERNRIHENFENIINWLLFGTVDFDFLCESTLPSLCKVSGNKLTVGKMEYSAILVPECETLRKTTVDILNQFIDCGGRVIFVGKPPKYIDAKENRDTLTLYNRSEKADYCKYDILKVLENERDIEITNKQEDLPPQFIYQLKQDGAKKYLFIAKARPTLQDHRGLHTPVETSIRIKGEYTPVVMNTLSGEIEKISYKTENGYTNLCYTFYENDSLLLELSSPTISLFTKDGVNKEKIGQIHFMDAVKIKREEENVLLLDMAEFILDNGMRHPFDEILKADLNFRKELGWNKLTTVGLGIQPWAAKEEETVYVASLTFKVECEEEFESTYFCAENLISLNLNNCEINPVPCGYFVDKAIVKYPLTKLKKGQNIIKITLPFGERTTLENCFIVGEFDVFVCGIHKMLKKPKNTICFGDITSQGLAFYGGNLSYVTEIDLPQECDLVVNIAKYRGALTQVHLDGKNAGNIVFPPYNLEIKGVSKGKHTIEFKLFGNRYNTFGALHNCGMSRWYALFYYTSEGDEWCYEYNFKKTGILKSPVIELYKEQSDSVTAPAVRR